ncbi:hypothetical protein K488DRAFT_74410 [Vararia minispora EC-137]|uniref:Uncharacterized protein n=1 Tax=Vararia minispora EC-137 TaxID=1314806 RepID=A0ACB8Q746_9AGAM|nr:hypothetical protein K488DRAFT_74410 [Vararia minispora EC-137]
MYAMALAHWIAGFSGFVAIFWEYKPGYRNDWSGFHYDSTDIVLSATFTTTVLISDAVVLWRACVVWPNNRAVYCTCVILFLITFGMVQTVSLTLFAVINLTLGDVNGIRNNQTDFRFLSGTPFGFFFSIPSFFVVALSFLSNLFAPSAIWYQAWRHRQNIRAHFAANGPQKFLAEKILVIFVESGVIYLCLWTLYFIASFLNIPPYFAYFMTQITAMYPTIIIILVTVEKICDRQKNLSSPSRVTLPPIEVTLGTVTSRSPNSVRSHVASPYSRLALAPIEISVSTPASSVDDTSNDDVKVKQLENINSA